MINDSAEKHIQDHVEVHLILVTFAIARAANPAIEVLYREGLSSRLVLADMTPLNA